MKTDNDNQNPPKMIVVYDGNCGMCNRTVVFIKKRSRQGKFRFIAGDSETLKKEYPELYRTSQKHDSVIFYHDGKIRLRSAAVLHISRHLRGGWPMLYALIIVPAFLRDGVYRFIASIRRKIFPAKKHCSIQ